MRETPEAALAFEQYYDLGEDRSLLQLARKQRQEIIDKRQDDAKVIPTEAPILSKLKKWSAEHKWQDRVIARDRANAEKERKKRDKAIEAMNERHAMIGTTQQVKAIEQIKALIEAKSFGSMAAVQLLKMATDLERLARGAPTEHAELTGKDGGPIQIITKWAGSAVVEAEEDAEP